MNMNTPHDDGLQPFIALAHACSICVRCPSIPPAMPPPYALYTSCRGATPQPAEHQPPLHNPTGVARLAADTRMPPCNPAHALWV